MGMEEPELPKFPAIQPYKQVPSAPGKHTKEILIHPDLLLSHSQYPGNRNQPRYPSTDEWIKHIEQVQKNGIVMYAGKWMKLKSL